MEFSYNILARCSAQVSVILGAAAEGPAELDDCIQTLGKADLLDSDLTEYVASLVTAEVREIGCLSLLFQPPAFGRLPQRSQRGFAKNHATRDRCVVRNASSVLPERRRKHRGHAACTPLATFRSVERCIDRRHSIAAVSDRT